LDRLDKREIQNLVDKLSSYLDEPRVKPDDLPKVGRALEFGIPYLVESVWKKLKLYRFSGGTEERRYEKPMCGV
jgi:hypothetical protein